VRWTIAGNLPYNISKPVAMRLVESVASVERAVLMFQREVAQRLCAVPGGADYGPLSVLPRAVYEIDRVMDVSPGAFRPRPGVVSTVTRWLARDERPSTDELARLRATLRAAFSNRRKTLRNNVRRALGSENVLEQAGLDGARRAQELSPEEFHALAAYWPKLP
jgi:16S rRNA (adenine1518-N6/adenine1519-N6)-dimethyltransferase